MNTILEKKHRNDGEKIVRTRCRRIVKNPDRLMYEC